jgi:hypothetical protein
MQQPEIDPHYFENDFGQFCNYEFQRSLTTLADLELLVQHFEFAKALVEAEPFKSVIGSEVDPGAKCTTDEKIRGWFISVIISLCILIVIP